MNKPRSLHFSYRRYLANQLRDNFNLEGSPILIYPRKKGEKANVVEDNYKEETTKPKKKTKKTTPKPKTEETVTNEPVAEKPKNTDTEEQDDFEEYKSKNT